MAMDTKKKLQEIVAHLNGQKNAIEAAKIHVEEIKDPELTKKFEAATKSCDDVVQYVNSRIDHK